MSWAAIGAAAAGAVISAYSASEQQKAQQKALEQQTAAQAGLSQEQMAQQKELAEKQFAQQLAILTGTQAGQEEALARAQERESSGIAQFLAATEGKPQEVGRLQQIIREQQLPEQQQALRRAKLAQTQAGVRGPEAALLQQMQARELGKQLGLEVEKIGLEEALRRQRSREQFAGAQALAAQAATLRPVQKVDEAKIQETIEAQKGKLATEAEKKALQGYYSVEGTLGDKNFSGDYYLTPDDEILIDQMKEIGKYGL
jgi:hypothetical protein